MIHFHTPLTAFCMDEPQRFRRFRYCYFIKKYCLKRKMIEDNGDHERKKFRRWFFSFALNIQNISSILSADMVFIEENSMNIVADVVSDLFSQLVLTAFLFTIHPLLGAAALCTEFIAVLAASSMSRESMRNSAARQQAIQDLTGAVIEYTEGLGVSKSFCVRRTALLASFAFSAASCIPSVKRIKLRDS